MIPSALSLLTTHMLRGMALIVRAHAVSNSVSRSKMSVPSAMLSLSVQTKETK
jgi:hypothetical protein